MEVLENIWRFPEDSRWQVSRSVVDWGPRQNQSQRVTSTSESVRYRFGRFELQPEERRLLGDGVAVRVGGHALDLLLVFVERSGCLVSKDDLLSSVWRGVVVEENTLQSHIAALRKVLGADAIATVSGRGYRFVLDVARLPGADSNDGPIPQHNLPHALTSFVGRATELAELGPLVHSCRLLTLTGAGGCGKTRLALRLAHEHVARFAQGVRLVELAPLGSELLVPQAVAAALGIKEQPGQALGDTIIQWLESRNLLLVLDNAEHVVSRCASVVEEILKRCGHVTVVVTSREPLGIDGERVYRVPSLSMPADHQGPPHANASVSDALQLLLERTRLHQPDLVVGQPERVALLAICRRLDGIALAIELAAARLRTLSIDELSRHLDRRFVVLTGGSRTALPRHRTLRSLVDWSYDLLSEPEKTLLQRLSVFAGGCDLDYAEHVCGADGLPREGIIDLLTALTDKNLVLVEASPRASRFRMLETIRQYAAEKLAATTECSSVRTRHFEYVEHLATDLARKQPEAERPPKVNRIGDDVDNLRAALVWCADQDELAARRLRCVTDLIFFWHTRCHFSEGRAWIERFLPVATEPDALRGDACFSLSVLAYAQQHYELQETAASEAYAIWMHLGMPKKACAAIGNLGNTSSVRGDYGKAREQYGEALRISRELGDRLNVGRYLSNLGWCAYLQGDLPEARRSLEETLPTLHECGPWTAASVLHNLGEVLRAQGEFDEAHRRLAEALTAFQGFGDKLQIAAVLITLSELCADQGDKEGARSQLLEALPTLRAVEDRFFAAQAMESCGNLAMAEGRAGEAVRLWAQVERIFEDLRLSTHFSKPLEAKVAAARRTLSDTTAFERAYAAGRNWSLGEALGYADTVLAQLPSIQSQ